MAFFAPMGTVWYTMDDGSKIMINDLTVHAAFDERWKTDARTLLDYTIRDGELPHQISYRLYGTVDYWWTILLFNDIYDFENQWPRSPDALEDYIEKKYPDNSPDDLHHYIDSNGLIADLLAQRILYGIQDDATVIDVANLEPVTILEFETAANDTKRAIKLIDPDYIGDVQSEYEKLMASEA